MRLTSIPEKSDAWELIYWQEMLPKLSFSLDENFPGYANKFSNKLDEDYVMEIFNNCCEKLGYQIAVDDKDSAFLVRKPLSYVTLSKFSDEIERIKGKDIDGSSIDKGTILNRVAASMSAKKVDLGEGLVNWSFNDRSSIENDNGAIRATASPPKFSKDNFDLFLRIFKRELDSAMRPDPAPGGLTI